MAIIIVGIIGVLTFISLCVARLWLWWLWAPLVYFITFHVPAFGFKWGPELVIFWQIISSCLMVKLAIPSLNTLPPVQQNISKGDINNHIAILKNEIELLETNLQARFNNNLKEWDCPYCKEEIKGNALICKHCHSNLSDENINLLLEQKKAKLSSLQSEDNKNS